MDRTDRAAFMFIGILVILAVVPISIATYASVMKRTARNALGICLDANYPRVEYGGGQWYCIGIRDGSSVAVPVGEMTEIRVSFSILEEEQSAWKRGSQILPLWDYMTEQMDIRPIKQELEPFIQEAVMQYLAKFVPGVQCGDFEVSIRDIALHPFNITWQHNA